MSSKLVKIGGACGGWGDASHATRQLLESGDINYIVYDYLAEITMSIMARARAVDESKGYALDFVTAALKSNLSEIQKQGVKIISNAGGVNPLACAEAIRNELQKQELNLKVEVVIGDDLMDQVDRIADMQLAEMFSGATFPQSKSIRSMNAYLGAFPIAKALEDGADIVITGRCVDTAVTLGACIYEFGWQANDLDLLAQASLAGHLIECGPQVCGGNFTDWQEIADTLPDVGYPIVEVSASGEFVCTKPSGTGGVVSIGTVSEQLVYEIGDPKKYYLPDVICDFSEVSVTEEEPDRVKVIGAKGVGVPNEYKVSVTHADGYRTGLIFTMYGGDAALKAKKFAENAFKRARVALFEKGFADFKSTCVEIIGAESHYGNTQQVRLFKEVDVKVSVIHEEAKAVGLFIEEVWGTVLASPPGLCSFAGARAKPSPVVRLFSTLIPKNAVDVFVVTDSGEFEVGSDYDESTESSQGSHELSLPEIEFFIDPLLETVEVPLVKVAWMRSGDKGNKANIGVIARDEDYLPYIASSLTAEKIGELFSHFLEQPERDDQVERYYLSGIHALNFLIHDVLGGGGVASLRNDPQGKGYGQILLDQPIAMPLDLAKKKGLVDQACNMNIK